MTHKRREIKAVVVGRLINETAAEGNVFNTRLFTQDKFEVPAIFVWIKDETNEPRNHGEQMDRTGVLMVEVRAKGDPSGDTLLDQLTNEVERFIFCGENREVVDMTLDGNVDTCWLAGTRMEYIQNTHAKFSVAEMSYSFEYTTVDEPCGDAPLFLRVTAEIDGIGRKGEGPDGVTDIIALRDDLANSTINPNTVDQISQIDEVTLV